MSAQPAAPYNEFTSPTVVGVKDWSMCSQSIKTLLADFRYTHFVLNFYHAQKMPQFALTALGPKQLFWKLVEEDTPVRDSAHVRTHSWTRAGDAAFWEQQLECDARTPVTISLHRIEGTPTKILIEFGCGKKSSVYTFNLSPQTHDAYMMFLVPYKKFKTGMLKLQSTHDYLQEYSTRILSSSLAGELVHCAVCQEQVADIVLEDCGHCVYCAKCMAKVKENKEKQCPFCRVKYGATHKRVLQDESALRCLVCPPVFECRRMDCMLLPCRCVVGCKRYTKRAIHPDAGDCCPNCTSSVQQLLKVYVQHNG